VAVEQQAKKKKSLQTQKKNFKTSVAALSSGRKKGKKTHLVCVV
jgi:hypothetical protein